MTEKNNYAVFILTNGRANNVRTYTTLRRQGYTGAVYFIIDDEDEQKNEYIENFGDQVYMFSKAEAAKYTDTCSPLTTTDIVVYARNTCWKIAEDLGIEFFIVLDDDYVSFGHSHTEGMASYADTLCHDLDRVFDLLVEYYASTPFATLSITQGGDYIGGRESTAMDALREGRLLRKAMNLFICSVNRPFSFVGYLNEDTSTYVLEGQRGKIFATYCGYRLQQPPTQQNEGGLTGAYNRLGTYHKSFYSVMVAPSCVKIGEMGNLFKRLHHTVRWKNTCPKIIAETHRKT